MILPFNQRHEHFGYAVNIKIKTLMVASVPAVRLLAQPVVAGNRSKNLFHNNFVAALLPVDHPASQI